MVLHLGQGDWMMVDSFIDAGSDTPVALDYLRRIGVDPSNAVRLIVATHWHDDHIRGIAKVFRAATNAVFSITGAFQEPDFRLILAPWLANSSPIDGKGLGEVADLLTISKQRRCSPVLSSANKILWERHGEIPVQVRALSPSDPAIAACIARLRELDPGIFRCRLPLIESNHASVVLSVQVGSRRILLGGDLECRADRKFGWLAIVDSQKGAGAPKHHLFKIPHHGSSNGHHQEVWTELLNPNPLSALTPFVHGGVRLPTPSDVARIGSHTTQAYLTAVPRAGKFHDPDRTVEKTMREAARKLTVIPRSSGHVCMRGRHGEDPAAWKVTCHKGASHLEQVAEVSH